MHHPERATRGSGGKIGALDRRGAPATPCMWFMVTKADLQS